MHNSTIKDKSLFVQFRVFFFLLLLSSLIPSLAFSVTYTIAGSVIDNSGTNLIGVVMNGLPGNPTTDISGNYVAYVTAGWSGTVTPTLTGFTFSPVSRSYSNVQANAGSQNFTWTWTKVGVASNDKPLPLEFKLYQNYPNPFNPSTTISFSLPAKNFVSLKIFDITGREVTTLFNEILSAGIHIQRWNAVNMPSGTYFYLLQAGASVETKKLVLLK